MLKLTCRITMKRAGPNDFVWQARDDDDFCCVECVSKGFLKFLETVRAHPIARGEA
jgi:hypothetical protein